MKTGRDERKVRTGKKGRKDTRQNTGEKETETTWKVTQGQGRNENGTKGRERQQDTQPLWDGKRSLEIYYIFHNIFFFTYPYQKNTSNSIYSSRVKTFFFSSLRRFFFTRFCLWAIVLSGNACNGIRTKCSRFGWIC